MLAKRGAPERTVVTVNGQTAGRGRAGRSWHNEPGAALQATAILRPRTSADRLPVLSLLIGVAVAEAIEAMTGAEVRLKWPNDVWLGPDPERLKVAGILMTSRLRPRGIDHVLVGIGINVTTSHAQLPPGATSLREATGWRGSPGELLPVLLPALDRIYGVYTHADGFPSLDAWRARAALLGEGVTIKEHGSEITGVLTGIDDDGALVLETDHAMSKRIFSGDVVRGPRRATDSSS